jgi:hypothetical protein
MIMLWVLCGGAARYFWYLVWQQVVWEFIELSKSPFTTKLCVICISSYKGDRSLVFSLKRRSRDNQ